MNRGEYVCILGNMSELPQKLEKYWQAVEINETDLHVIPFNDWIQHELADNCVCIPETESLENGYWMYTHASLDGRELNE